MNASECQQALTPTAQTSRQTRYNAPGQDALTYNVSYSDSLRNMLARLSREAQLNKLTPDAYEDWSIALLHSWAIVLDVLAFYQERIINEGYLLTATERRSILELARTVGYELRPALAASANLVLTVAPDAEGQPQKVEIKDADLRREPLSIQSTPQEGKLPQIFEIAEPFVARTEWNSLLPETAITALEGRSAEATAGSKTPLIIYPNQTTIRLAGVRNDLQPDDTLLLIGDDPPSAQPASATAAANEAKSEQRWHLRKLKTVQSEPSKGYTQISWQHQRYHFQLDPKFASELDNTPAADKPILSEELRKAFQDAGYPLTTQLVKDIIDAGSRWLIDEVEEEPKVNRHYIIQHENQILAVYEDIDKLTKPLYNSQFFIFRQQAKLLTYAKGALFHAEVAAPTPEATDAITQGKPTWAPFTLGLPPEEINALATNSQGTLFAATKQDMLRLEPNDTSWQSVATGLVQRNITALLITASDDLYVGSNTGGIYRSKDNGENWTPLSGDTVAPAATIKKPNDTTFNVELSGLLPKAPVQTLASDGQKQMLYALVNGKPYQSSDMEGTSWEATPESATQPPTAVEAAATAVAPAAAATTQTILQQFLPLGTLLTTLVKAAQWLQWLGIDLRDFLSKSLRSQPLSKQIQALAVVNEGKQSDLLFGTADGAFRLPSKISRWWVAALVVVLTILWNIAVGGATQPIPFPLIAQGKLMVASTLTGAEPLTTTATFTANTGSWLITPITAFSQVVPVTLDVNGQINLTAQFVSTDTLTGTAILTASGVVTALDEASDWLTKSVQIGAVGLLELKPGFTFSRALQAVGNIKATGNLTLVSDSLLSTTQVTTVTLRLTGNVKPAATASGGEGSANWFATTWTQIVTLVVNAIQLALSTVQSYWQALQAQLPDPLKTALSWLYTNILQPLLQPLLAIVQRYLLQPLLNQTANQLARASLVTAALLLIGLGWQYADRQMSNRRTVKVGKSVHVLAISPSGQVFAGSEEGLFRSPPANPQSSFLNRLEQFLLRTLFTDREMESVNEGLLPLNDGEAPDVRALTFDASGKLLVGTKKGRLFRYSQHTGEPALFGADFSNLAQFDQEKLTDDLRQKFETAKKPLTPAATLKVEQKGSLWSVTDVGIAYLIRKEGNKLNVYLDYQWETYDNGPLLAEVRTIVAMKGDLFVAGKALAGEKEEQWFAEELHAARIELDKVYTDLQKTVAQSGCAWFLLQPGEESTSGTATTATNQQDVSPALFSISKVESPVQSKEFAQAREMSRVTVNSLSETTPAAQLAPFNRETSVVLIQSEPLTLYDNRPLSGQEIKLDRYVAGLQATQRLAISGKVMHVRVAKGRQGQGLELKAKDERVEPKPLHPDKRLLVLDYQPQASPSDPTATDKTVSSWQLKDADGFVGSLQASENQLLWDLPTADDPLVSEIITIEQMLSEGVLPTRIELQAPLQYFYDRATVTLSANVVKATHGQSVRDEVLGNGTGQFANQQFELLQKPLTFLQTDTPTGYQSTLKVMVQKIEWRETSSLYKLDADLANKNDATKAGQSRAAQKERDRGQRVYLLRQDDEQKSYVRFGDGKKGTRLPSGIEQVTAEYRVGSGPDGNVPANAINQPQTLPSAIPVVSNPLAAQGGVEPEPQEQARDNAPLRIRTLGQIVSRTDYEDCVRQFAGIGRVRASKEFVVGGRKVLLLTIADSDGGTVAKDAPLITNLQNAIVKQRVARIPEVQVKGYKALYFNIDASLLIASDSVARSDEIMATIKLKIRQRFSFTQCDFAQSVARSEVIALIHSVEGVESVDDLYLWREDGVKERTALLTAQDARLENGQLAPAQMLLINPKKIGVTLRVTAEPLPSDKVAV